MITLKTSAMCGPMSLIVSGHLGESGFGNGSHYSKCAWRRYSLRHCWANTGRCGRTTTTLLGGDLPSKDNVAGQGAS